MAIFRNRPGPASALVGALLAFAATPALADRIDGDWCSADKRRLTINGPEIITPGGVRMTGDYDRHGFVYVTPPSEPGAGDRVVMVLQGEYQVQIRFGANGEPQTWRRCPPGIS